MRRSRFVLIAAAAVLAVASRWNAYQTRHDRLDIADGVVGFLLLSCAVVAWDRRPRSRVGALMGLAGLTWLAGSVGPGWIFLHRGPLVHLHLSYPSGRLRWLPTTATVIAAYVTATIGPLADNDRLTITLAVLVAGVAAGGFLRSTGTARRAGIPAVGAAIAFAAVLALSGFNQLARWDADRQVLWAYDIVVAALVVILLVDLLAGDGLTLW